MQNMDFFCREVEKNEFDGNIIEGGKATEDCMCVKGRVIME